MAISLPIVAFFRPRPLFIVITAAPEEPVSSYDENLVDL